MIKLTFLGTADAIPSAKRNHLSVLLNYNNENILVDCGEGTQRQFRKAGLNPGKVTRILITHWHGDHVFGIPGLLATFAREGYNKTLYIYGPKGTKTNIKKLLELYNFKKEYSIEVREVNGKFFETDEFYLESKPMTHGAPCNAYVFVKKGQVRIDKKKLKQTKLPSGPLLQKLKQGKDISYKDKKYFAKKLTFKEDDKKISFILDTSLNKNILPFIKNSDLLVCESMFDLDLKQRAEEYGHLTIKQTAELAKKSKSKKLILVHISQRYEKDLNTILIKAKKVFKNSFLVKDLEKVEI
ncbi:MAG: ribonuclease Z [Nanoarchaeota archaeon]|nr:ribonuclease Z [Nanoarchaeota archaeon]